MTRLTANTTLLIAGLVLSATPRLVTARMAIDEDSPWPRVRSTNGNTVTLHLPQVERWSSNWFSARTAVAVKPAGAKKEFLGVVWFEAHGSVDHTNRVVTLDRLEITKGQFPETTDNGSNALAIVREVIPQGARTVSLDYLITALGFEQAAARRGPHGFNHEPPEIIWVTNRTALILIDGEPVFRPVTNTPYERVINTPALLVQEKTNATFYLANDAQWFAAESIDGPWALVQIPPATLAAIAEFKADPSPTSVPPSAIQIIVKTHPAELLMTAGMPDFQPIKGTALQYAADSDNQLFFHTKERASYVLMSGRWFRSTSLKGPWSYIKPQELPDDFAKIPPNSPQAVVLASVPGTPQAELALISSSVPTTATISRDTKLEVEYDGEPVFKPISGTSMSYAANAPLPVIRRGDDYYALQDGVWFTASSAAGPWEVATEVPEEIYTIPPESPVYYATFARVYDSDDENVEVGYTPGYTGAYEDEGTMVYGTGWNYTPWYGNYYYGWGWTWGWSYLYVPWYQWWVWRPWWSDRFALRAAVIDNVYDRWQNPHVTPLRDSRTGTSRARERLAGYPALYGRFQGSTSPTSLRPPANTVALNPYTRPKTPVRSGEMPKGAQLLTSIQSTPGRGRDLYASPDGNVYLRKSDGWYRRQAGGNWNYFAPTHGQLQRNPSNPSPGATAENYRFTNPRASGNANLTRSDRVPNVGSNVGTREVAALEREYYARTLSGVRSQYHGQAYDRNRPLRRGALRQ